MSHSDTVNKIAEACLPTSLARALHQFLDDDLRPAAREIDQADEIPEEIYERLVDMDLLAHDPCPAGAGGSEETESMRQRFLHSVLQEIATISPAVAKAVMDQNMGQIGMIREYLPRDVSTPLLDEIRTGQVQACFAMTEPHSGSQLKTLHTSARRVPGGFEISGTKDWITGAHRRQLMAVVARDQEAPHSIGLFLLDRRNLSPATVQISDRKEKLGLRGLGEFTVTFDRAFCPEEKVVIVPSGHGLRQIMKHYNFKRCAQAAIAHGISLGALRSSIAYGRERFAQASGRDAMKHLMSTAAHLYCEMQAGTELRSWALGQLLKGDNSGVPSAMAKLFNTELAIRVTNAMAQSCGANGMSNKLPIERLMRDARMFTIAGGSSEVLRATVERNITSLIQ